MGTFDPASDPPFSETLASAFVLTPAGSSDGEGQGTLALNDDGMHMLGCARIFGAMSAKLYKDRWETQEIIGAGGAGVVVRANDKVLKQMVAVKVVMPAQGGRFRAEEGRRLRRETRAMNRVNHPSIARLHDSFLDDDKVHLLVMEYVTGRSLHDVIQSDGPCAFSQSKLNYLTEMVLGALCEMHSKNIIHLDIKPANIMLMEESADGSWLIKIIDFGLAQAPSTDGDRQSQSDVTTMMTNYHHAANVAGTLSFMPPEQLSSGQLDFRSDIFAVGITLYQLATGRFPHRRECGNIGTASLEVESWAETPPALANECNAGITEGFSRFIAKAIAPDPSDRYQTAAEMLAAFEALKRTVFISWRMAECKKEVRQLQPALEALGVNVIVVGELPGGDLKRAVEEGMAEAHLFIIMGTETYGKKTSGKIDTWAEMQEIKRSGKPFFLINLNPEASKMRFKEDLTNQLFDLDKETWHRWVPGAEMDPQLPGSIMEELSQ